MNANVSTNDLPKAIPAATANRARGLPGLVFIVSLAAIGLAVYATWASRKSEGIRVEIQFSDGEGLQIGDALRHRGVTVGEVTEIQLTDNLETVSVTALLREDAKQLATVGTRYWIVKPEASLQGLRGLETILSGQYIAVDPSRRKAEVCTKFDGLSSPPVVQMPGDALEVVLESTDVSGLQASAPISYRGLEVGRVQSIGLSPDARWVRVFASIDADYASLVRDNTVFWNRSGVKMNMGFGGLAVEANTHSSIAFGGIEFATPEPPGTAVAIGHRFELFQEPEEEWKEWQTPIATGPGLRLDLQSLPLMQQAAIKWKTSFYGIKRSQQRLGWVLTLSDGTLIGPADLFQVPEGSLPDSVTFECSGKSWPIQQLSLRSDAQARVLRVHFPDIPTGAENWPKDKLSKFNIELFRKGSGLILCEGNQRYVPMEANAFAIQREQVTLNNKEQLPKPVHGSTILNLADRSVVGVVIADDETSTFQVVPLPQ